MMRTIRKPAWLVGKVLLAVPALILVASVDVSSAFVTRFDGGCTQGTWNQVCTWIDLEVLELPGGSTRVLVVPGVRTAGVLRQGSMTSNFSGRETSFPFTFRRSSTDYCSWNGINEAGCSNGHAIDFPCQPGVTVELAMSLDASSNLLDSVHLTSHHQSLLVHLKQTSSCHPFIVTNPS